MWAVRGEGSPNTKPGRPAPIVHYSRRKEVIAMRKPVRRKVGVIGALLAAITITLTVTGCQGLEDPFADQSSATTVPGFANTSQATVLDQQGQTMTLLSGEGKNAPPVVPDDNRCRLKRHLSQFVGCFSGPQYDWYRDGLAANMARYTQQCGINQWNDIVELSKWRWPGNIEPDARVALIMGDDGSVSDESARAQARAEIRSVYGSTPEVEQYLSDFDEQRPVVRVKNPVNSTLADGKVTPFIERQTNYIRMALTFFVVTDKETIKTCSATVLDTCDNYTGAYKSPAKPQGGGTPSRTPSPSSTPTTPSGGGTPTPSSTPSKTPSKTPTPSSTPSPPTSSTPSQTSTPPVTTTRTLEPKVPDEDPAPSSQAPQGGGAQITPGPDTFVPETRMTRPPETSRTNPAPHPARPVPGATPVQPDWTPQSPATGAAPPEAAAEGEAPPPGE